MLNKNKFMTLLGSTVLALSLTACGNAQTTEVKPAAPVQSASAPAVMKLSQGQFSGRSDHVTTGQVSIEKTASGYELRFADDFFLDGAPDPVVALGNDNTFLVANKLGALKNKTGAQIYLLPDNFNPAQFSQVYVWCEKFSVPLGIADLT